VSEYFSEYRVNNPTSTVSGIFYSGVTLNFDLLICVPHCINSPAHCCI